MERRRHPEDNPLREALSALVRDGRELVERCVEEVEEVARAKPGEALAAAFIAGLLTAAWLRRDR